MLALECDTESGHRLWYQKYNLIHIITNTWTFILTSNFVCNPFHFFNIGVSFTDKTRYSFVCDPYSFFSSKRLVKYYISTYWRYKSHWHLRHCWENSCSFQKHVSPSHPVIGVKSVSRAFPCIYRNKNNAIFILYSYIARVFVFLNEEFHWSIG